MRYRLTIEYAGTKYSGWQIQQNARTIQGELQQAASEALGQPVEIQGSGRTDAGVHALGQVAHLDAMRDLPPETLRRRINDELPNDINVLSAARAHPRFHARHDALMRSYIYQIARRRTAFAKPFVWWVKDDLDLERMRDAAPVFVGFRDFRSFTDDDPSQKSTQVQVKGLEIFDDEDLLVIHMEASHFLWKMVRRIVGVLVEVGRGSMDRTTVDRLLREGSPEVATFTAPASGLFLERVFYANEPHDTPVRAAVRVGKA